MGVFLGQLPPAEIARLKAELAETLIAHFCYPRFYDYRTNSLRTRPVDRAKRQEVWLYLSAVDFTAWNRIDLMSTDFQHQIERLFIHFVQRNRSFFGEQGRKRMSDIRMLIGTAALTVVQGLRGHLTGHHQNNPPFGSPRPVSSWSTTNITRLPEPGWEQLAQNTMLLQQQLQEVRGEIKPTAVAAPNEVRSAAVAPRRVTRVPTTPVIPNPQPKAANGTNGVDHAATPIAASQGNRPIIVQPPASANLRSTSPLADTKSSPPVNPSWNAQIATTPSPQTKVEPAVSPVASSFAASVELPTAPVVSVVTPVNSTGIPVPPTPVPEKVQSPMPVIASTPVQQGISAATTTAAPATVPNRRENSAVMTGEEDVAIFEEMRHQLLVWLRVEAVRSGLDISNQGPTQLLDILRQQVKHDETRLQVVSNLLNICYQVMKTGKASPYDYKQALMYHLMHTKR